MKRILLLLLLINFSLLHAEIVPLNDENYEQTLNENKKTIIMFSATWCGACKQMKPIYKEFAETYKGDVLFASIDTDESEKASSAYNIESIPTTIVFENGKEVQRDSGSLDKEQLLMMIDVKQALAQLSEKCLAGDGRVCMDVADMYEEEKVIKQDYIKVFEYTEKSCDFGYTVGCNNLGYIYGNGEGVDVDLNKSIKFYSMACEKDYALACLNLGGLFKEGWYGADIDNEKSFAYFKKASTLDSDGEGYYELAKMYKEGLGTQKDKTRAEELFAKACHDGYEDACTDSEKITNDENLNETLEEIDEFSDNSTKILLMILGLYITLGLMVIVYTLLKRKRAK